MVNYHPRGKKVHGFAAQDHPAYNSWVGIKARCSNPNSPAYANYGGRGISMCQEWELSFEQFALDMGLPPTSEHTVDRIDNEKGYSKENCRWATRTEQCLNRRIFKNNTSGDTGIVRLGNGSFNARFDVEGKRYNLGRFDTQEEAVAYRLKFIQTLETDYESAIAMTERRVRRDSSTGIKGITQNKDGFLVRVTLPNGSRKYLGFSKTLEVAIEKLNAFNNEQN